MDHIIEELGESSIIAIIGVGLLFFLGILLSAASVF